MYALVFSVYYGYFCKISLQLSSPDDTLLPYGNFPPARSLSYVAESIHFILFVAALPPVLFWYKCRSYIVYRLICV
jgi:hypothetical protein